jgi:hypothetical protein
MQDNGTRRVAGQKATMRLDAAGNMDRLTVAIGKIDRIHRRHVKSFPEDNPPRRRERFFGIPQRL